MDSVIRHYVRPRDKWINKHREIQRKLWGKHDDMITDFIDNKKIWKSLNAKIKNAESKIQETAATLKKELLGGMRK